MVGCIDSFVDEVQRADTAKQIPYIMSQIDLEKMSKVTSFVYQNIPYFLTEKDYIRMEKALQQHDYVVKQLQHDKQLLMSLREISFLRIYNATHSTFYPRRSAITTDGYRFEV